MHDTEKIADLLIVAKTVWRQRDILGLDKELQDTALKRLNAYGVLSISALGALVGVSNYRVKKAIAGMRQPEARGHLNPGHISMLLFALSQGDIPPRWIEEMLDGGTSISTIADLTGVSESTIYRRRP